MGAYVGVMTERLVGAALDWAVAKAAGINVDLAPPHYGTDWRPFIPGENAERFAPSINWDQAGPLLESHQIGCAPVRDDWIAYPLKRNAPTDWINGPTALIAICRAIVADKLGLDVSIPQELAR